MLCFSSTYAANYYWIGGSGSWTSLLSWSTTSGGGINPSVLPGPTDDVFFDSNSFSFPGQLVSITGRVTCRNISFLGVGSNVPIVNGGSIEVFGNVELVEGLQVSTSIQLLGSAANSLFLSHGAILSELIVNRPNTSTQILDSLKCDKFFHENGNVDAQGIKMNLGVLRNRNNNVSSFLDLTDVFLEIDSFLISGNLWYNIGLSGSRLRVNKGVFSCGFLHFHVIEVSDKAVIGSELNNACASFGFSGFKIDSLFVPSSGEIQLVANDNDKGPLEIGFIKGGSKATMNVARPLQIHSFEWDGFIDIQEDNIEVEILQLGQYASMRMKPSVSMQSPRLTVRQQWDVFGECSSRVLLYSSVTNEIVYVESSATLQFDFVEIVDVRLIGGGPQNLSNTRTAGKTNGFTGVQNTGRSYYWIGNSGDWEDGSHWSFTNGGSPSFCVPGILDTVHFTPQSFTSSLERVTHHANSALIVRNVICTNDGLPFEWDILHSELIVATSAIIKENATFVSPISIQFYGSVVNVLDIRGEQPITQIESRGSNGFLIVTDSLNSPDCELITNNQAVDISGLFWNLRTADFNESRVDLPIREFHVDSIKSYGKDNTFTSGACVIHAREKVLFKDAEVSLLSLHYYGTETCLIERYQRLDSLFIFRPSSFFTFNDTVSGPPLAPISTLFANQSGDTGFTKVKGVFVREGTTLGDIDLRNCEFDRLRMFQTGLFYLSGNLKINQFFSNTGNCGRQSYFMKNPDSLGVYYFLSSNTDSLVFSHFHIYGIDAQGTADFIARDCKDMGLNSGWKFSGAKGKTYYWIGKKGNFLQAANWSETSNGSPSFCLPSALDTVIFDRFSFNSNTDTVFLPDAFPVTVRSWIVRDSLNWTPVFWSKSQIYVNILKDFKLLSNTFWPISSRISFFVNRDTGFISSRFSQPEMTLSMGHPGTLTRYMLEDTLRVGSVWMGFGNFHSRNFPIYAHTYIADYAPGYPIGDVTGKSILTNTYLEIDSVKVFQEFNRPNFMRGRADMTGTKVKCRNFVMSFLPGEYPMTVEFYPQEKGFFAIGTNGLQGGRVDSLIALGGVRLYAAEASAPPGVIEMDYLEVDSLFDAWVPTKIAYADVKGDGYFKMFHDFGDVFFYKNRTYQFDPMSQVSYQYMGASASSCEPITIIGKEAGKQFTLLKKQAAVFDGQGVRMRDCISGGGVSYMGPQSVSLGNNKDWIIGRDPSYNLVDLSQDFELCENDSVYISARTLYPNAKEYLWKIDGQPFFPGEFGFFLGKSGFYTLEAKYTDNCSLFDSAHVSVFTRDLLNLGNDTTLCQGGFVQLRPTLDSGMSYTWSTGSRQPGIVVTRSGIYWLRLTNPKGCTISDSVFIGFVTRPVNPAGKDTVVCANTQYITGVVHKNYWYQWSNGDTTPQIPVGQGGVFTLRMGNGICYVEDTVNVQVDNPIQFTLGNDTVMLTGQSLALRSSEILPNYKWSTGATSAVIFVEMDGHYSLETKSGVCKTSDTIWVRFRPPLTVDFNTDTVFLCEGETSVLVPKTNRKVLQYLWNNAATDSVLSDIGTQGWYSVEVRDSFFIAKDSIYVHVQPSILFDLGNDTLLCDGDTIRLQAPLSDTYLWSDGTQSAIKKVETAGRYSVEVTQGVCYAKDSINIAYLPYPVLDFQSDTLLCEGGEVKVSLPNSQYQYRWNDGNTDAERIFVSSGTYTLEAQNGPCVTTYGFSATFQSIPAFELGSDTVLCEASSLELDASRAFAIQYLWSDGLPFAKRMITTTGMYAVQLFDGVCYVEDSLEVLFSEIPYVSLGSDTSICNGEFPEIIAQVKQSGLQFEWSNGSILDRITAFDTGTYSVTVSNAYCSASDTIEVFPCDCDVVYIPTAFSPNGDGLNDEFKPEECYMGYYEMEIYNRWGQKIFESNNREKGWGGEFNGQASPQGIYLYKITFDALYGTGGVKKRYNLTGSVMLIR